MEAVALLSLLLLLSGPEVDSAVDWTVKSNATGEEVVESVVDMIQQSCIFPDDRLMLRRIAKVETDDGYDKKTYSVKDFYGGIWQIDKPSFTQTKSFHDEKVYSLINKTFKVDWKTLHYHELAKPLYSGLAARLKIASHFRSTDLPHDIHSQAHYWAQHFTVNSWGTPANAIERYKQASNRTAKRCSAPKADVVFVLDSSGSITLLHFEKVRQFVVNVVQSFVIGPKYVRVALVQFSDVARIEYDFTTYTTKAEIVTATSAIPYMDSGTNTVAGLQALESVVTNGARLDDAVPVVAILMTDGRSNETPLTLLEAARVHQSLGSKMTVYAIGVGDGVDPTELDAIATPPSCQHKFNLASFDDITAFSYQIMKKACEEPAPITENRAFTVEVTKGETSYFKAVARRKGQIHELTVKTKDRSRAKLFLSHTNPKPSVANHDYMYEVGGPGKEEVKLKIPFKEDKSENSVRRRRRRQVDNSTDEADNVDGPTTTLYGALEGIGEEEDGNSFDISYTVSYHPDVGVVDHTSTSSTTRAIAPTVDDTTVSTTELSASSSAIASRAPAVVLLLVQLTSLCSNFK